jgi:hypothetical protein
MLPTDTLLHASFLIEAVRRTFFFSVLSYFWKRAILGRVF